MIDDLRAAADGPDARSWLTDTAKTEPASPLSDVAIVIPTHNEERNLGRLLGSIRMQRGVTCEVVIVDQDSTDRTREIARSFDCTVIRSDRPSFYSPPGPSRNLGSSATRASILLHLDADMELRSPSILSRLTRLIDEQHRAAIIHEVDVPLSFWNKCKALERKCYLGTPLESARAVTRALFEEVGGYDTDIASGEDLFISARYRSSTAITSEQGLVLFHHTGSATLASMLRKKYLYGKTASRYLAKARAVVALPASKIMRLSVRAYVANASLLLRDPIHFLGIFPLRVMELGATSLGILAAKLGRR